MSWLDTVVVANMVAWKPLPSMVREYEKAKRTFLGPTPLKVPIPSPWQFRRVPCRVLWRPVKVGGLRITRLHRLFTWLRHPKVLLVQVVRWALFGKPSLTPPPAKLTVPVESLMERISPVLLCTVHMEKLLAQ